MVAGLPVSPTLAAAIAGANDMPELILDAVAAAIAAAAAGSAGLAGSPAPPTSQPVRRLRRRSSLASEVRASDERVSERRESLPLLRLRLLLRPGIFSAAAAAAAVDRQVWNPNIDMLWLSTP